MCALLAGGFPPRLILLAAAPTSKPKVRPGAAALGGQGGQEPPTELREGLSCELILRG